MAYIYDLTDTWNAGGTTFNAIKMNVTDSASAAGSKLVTLQTNGTEHFSVTKAGVGYFSGNVGIGINSPLSKLTVSLGNATGGGGIGSFISWDSTFASFGQTGATSPAVGIGYSATYGGILTCIAPLVAWQSMNYLALDHKFYTSATEKMRITSAGELLIGRSSASGLGKLNVEGGADFTGGNVLMCRDTGNVGIGTSSPAVKLEVASANAITSLRVDTENAGVSANNYSEIALADNNAVRTWWRNVRDGTGKTAFGYNNHLAFLSDAGGTPTERARIDSSGNVGIGTSSPTSISNYKAITLDATTGTFIDFRENGTNRLRIGGDGGTAFINGASGTLRLLTSDVERARIDTSGNLLVGATATLNNGRFFLNFTGSNGAVFQTDSTATQYQAQFYINGTRVGTISTSGTTTAYNTTSDYRLKNVDGPITNSGAYIDALRPVQGSWKADGARFIGLIAHEVQEVSETLIATGVKDGDEMQAMDYSAPELIANLIAEIQSLRARVAQLEGN